MNPLARAVALVLAVSCLAYLPAGAQISTPTPAATPAPTVSPGASPTPTVSPSASPTPTPIPILILPPDAPPQILDMTISSNTVNVGDTLTGSVVASSNVASVEVRVATYSYNMVKVAPGQFTLAITVPRIPRMFWGTYPLTVIARNTRGDATQRTTQLTIH